MPAKETARMHMGFEEAVQSLPDTADDAVELQWVRSHWAMIRSLRLRKPKQIIVLTAGDVLHSPNGPAPSKAAVYQLQYWCNYPDKFFSALLAVAGKRAAAGGKPAMCGLDGQERQQGEVEDDMSDLEEMVGSPSATGKGGKVGKDGGAGKDK